IQPQMNMQSMSTVEMVQEMLAVRLRLPQHQPINQRCPGCEPPLRTPRPDHSPREQLPMPQSQPMNSVSLRHPLPLTALTLYPTSPDTPLPPPSKPTNQRSCHTPPPSVPRPHPFSGFPGFR